MKKLYMKNNFAKTYLCPCPIYKVTIDPSSYDKEKIINDIKYNKSLKNIRTPEAWGTHKNLNIHHSYDDHENEDFRIINYDKLISVYQKIFEEFFDKIIATKNAFKWKFNIVNYTAMSEGQWFPPHDHIRFDDFTCVHYLNFKDDHVQTTLYNPATFAPYLHLIRPDLTNVLDETGNENQYAYSEYQGPAEEDDMIIFPTAIAHEVKPQGPTKEPRITISTNLRITLGQHHER